MLDATEQIARDYQVDQNLNQARAELSQLDVINLNQWLIYSADEAISAHPDTEAANALAALTVDLGIASTQTHEYALQRNLGKAVVSAAVAPTAQVAVSPTPLQIGAALQSNVGASAANVASNQQDEASNQPEAQAVEQGQTLAATSTITAGASAVLLEPTPIPTDATPTATPDQGPAVKAASDINIRVGPGTDYPIAGALRVGEMADLTGKNADGSWWEIALSGGQSGWVYAPLVETNGDTNAVAVAANIPPPPPTATPAPTEPPAEAPPAEAPAAPPASGKDFQVVDVHLWDVVENGGQLNGPSVTCGEKRQLVVIVLDANGNRLNGVAVQALYGAQEVFTTGDEGKGDGIVEFVLGGGQAVKVIRDSGRDVTSDEVYNLSTKPWEIPYDRLIGGRFCSDEASCKSFVDQTGCYGHYSYTVTFKRSY
ncbi:MAG: SH3 domain-containing protein [Caldilineaceae bacterium]